MNLFEKYSKKFKECNTKLTIEPESCPADDRELFEERAAIMEFDGGLTREEAEKKAAILTRDPVAAKIRSKILQEDVWVVTHSDAIEYVPEGELYYLPEEIRNLRGATPEEIQAVHKVKREVGGQLIMVNDIKEHVNN